jgi:ATP-dependent phosphofructokinase / diphosphate-dependent phosphofructokinase
MRIGVLTGGGDAPGLNPAIRAVVLRATALGHDVMGIADGWAGLVDGRARPLSERDVAHILDQGGTMLGTSRTDPRKNERDQRACLGNIGKLGLEALVAIGGNDTLGVADWLHSKGVRVVGVPKTVDNDLSATDYCIGFDTAVSVVTEALDRLRTTASSHHRVMVVEAMGRDTGWVAAVGGIAGGADVILVPEIPVTADEVVDAVRHLKEHGDDDIIVVVSEAVEIEGLEAQTSIERDAFGHPRLDQRAIGAILARHIEQRTAIEARVVVLGHLQRGGSPTVIDRFWATRLGVSAVDLVTAGKSGVLPVARGGKVAVVTISEAVGTTRRLDPELIELIGRLAGTRPQH